MHIHIFAFLLVNALLARALEKRGKMSDYVFGDVIGTGAFASVFLAKNTATNQTFVAKVPRNNSKLKDLLLFTREINLLEAISEKKIPNVIKYVDSFTDPETGNPVLVMEKANGIEFFTFIVSNGPSIKNGLFDRFLIIRLMHEAAQGVKQVHDLGICHRDIKPENFMLTTKNPTFEAQETLLKLVDFGFASKVNEAKGFAGTPNYVSPELANAIIRASSKEMNGESYVDQNCKSTDIYALGITFYALLSVRLPYSYKGNKFELLKMISRGRYSIPRSVEAHYPQMIPLLNSMLGAQESRGSIDDVVKFIELLLDVERQNLQHVPGNREPAVVSVNTQSVRNQRFKTAKSRNHEEFSKRLKTI